MGSAVFPSTSPAVESGGRVFTFLFYWRSQGSPADPITSPAGEEGVFTYLVYWRSQGFPADPPTSPAVEEGFIPCVLEI
jgi:hypothetical protein